MNSVFTDWTRYVKVDLGGLRKARDPTSCNTKTARTPLGMNVKPLLATWPEPLGKPFKSALVRDDIDDGKTCDGRITFFEIFMRTIGAEHRKWDYRTCKAKGVLSTSFYSV